jgi:hypothetical protein
MMTKENKSENSRAATSAVGAIDATAFKEMSKDAIQGARRN